MLKFNQDLIIIGVGRLLSAVVSLLAIRACTTLLEPDIYGELALLLTIQMFCGLFLINPVGQHINLNTHIWWDEGSLAPRLKSYRGYVLIVSVVGGAVTILVHFNQQLSQLVWTSIVVTFMVFTATWNATLIPMLNMLGFRLQSVLLSVGTALFSLLFSIGLTIYSPSASTWLGGQAIGMLIGAIGAKVVLSRCREYKNVSKLSIPVLSKSTVRSYCLPLSIATGLMWVQLSGYRFIVEEYWGLAALGFLVVGFQVANQLFSIAETIFSQLLYPMFYRQISDENDENEGGSLSFSDLLNTLVPIYLVLAGFIVMAAPHLLKILVSSKFREAYIFVMLGGGLELFRVLANLFANATQITKKTRALSVPYAVGAVTSLTLLFIAGTLKMQILIVGIALTLGSVAMFTVMWWRMIRQVTLTIDKRRWYQGFFAMVGISSFAIWLPIETHVSLSLSILMIGATCSGAVMVALLLKNPALKRLLAVQLRKAPH